VVDTQILELLKDTVEVTPETYIETVFEEGVDTIVFFFTTEQIIESMRNIAFQFNIMASAIKQLGIDKTFKSYVYDTNKYVFPDSIDYTLGLPIIYFFPAYNKRAPFLRFNGEGHAGTFLKWVQKHADVPITYPIDVSRIGSPKTEEEIQHEADAKQAKADQITKMQEEQAAKEEKSAEEESQS
jgi:hypothetical protein